MMTQELDRETERYLADILQQQQMTTDELIRQLIHDRWLMLQQVPTSPERHAELESELALATPKPRNQKQVIADFVRRKHQRVV